jgi:hypothetical protein
MKGPPSCQPLLDKDWIGTLKSLIFFNGFNYLGDRLRIKYQFQGFPKGIFSLTDDLRTEFAKIETISDYKKRGREFEVFLTRLFDKEKIMHKGRYRPKGEEIDGAILLHGRTYLIEAKWRKKPEPASSVYSFRGKIEGKLEGTLGIFWSINGYSENCIPTVIAGKTLNVILFDRSDLEAILDDEISFGDLLTEKVLSAGRYGLIFVPWHSIKESERIRTKIDESYAKSIVLVIVDGEYDATILTSLFKCCFKEEKMDEILLVTIPVGSKANVVVRAPVYVMSLFSKSSTYCIVMIDRDEDSDDFVENFRDRLSDVAGSGKDRLYLAVPTPKVWTWLNLDSKPTDLKLHEFLKSFDWNDAISRHSDLQDLVNFIKQIK